MTEERGPTPRGRSHRRFDRLSKLLGVCLVAAGLHVGGGSAVGVLLGLLGVACVLLPVVLAGAETPPPDAGDD